MPWFQWTILICCFLYLETVKQSSSGSGSINLLMQSSITPIEVDQHPFPFRTLFIPAYHDWYLPRHDWYLPYHHWYLPCYGSELRCHEWYTHHSPLFTGHLAGPTWVQLLELLGLLLDSIGWFLSCHHSLVDLFPFVPLQRRTVSTFPWWDHGNLNPLSLSLSLSLSFSSTFFLSLSINSLSLSIVFYSLLWWLKHSIKSSSNQSEAKSESELVETVVPFDTWSRVRLQDSVVGYTFIGSCGIELHMILLWNTVIYIFLYGFLIEISIYIQT